MLSLHEIKHLMNQLFCIGRLPFYMLYAIGGLHNDHLLFLISGASREGES